MRDRGGGRDGKHGGDHKIAKSQEKLLNSESRLPSGLLGQWRGKRAFSWLWRLRYKGGMLPEAFQVRRLGPADVPLVRQLNALFAEAFRDPESYASEPPSDDHLAALLAREHVFVLVALAGEAVVGGLVGYELDKFEKARREVYIYDLAVDAQHRRRGVATALIEHLRGIASQRGAWVIYVQADYGDDPAIALYEKQGVREEVLHFDIKVDA
jgi:aminoglycoside 3-N-acetyltransferase I